MYLKKYHELPAQPGIVDNSNGKTDLLSIKSQLTIICFSVSQAYSLALPNGGSPSSVGRYLSTLGNSKGSAEIGRV